MSVANSKNIKQDPLKSRSCTDVICLLIFILFIIGWILISIFAFSHGDLTKIEYPTDSNGNQCGVGVNRNRPNLFFFDLRKCLNPFSLISGCQTEQVCVEKCPNDLFYNGIETLWKIENLICIDSVSKSAIKSKEEAKKFIEDKKCAEYYIPSESVLNRCIPDPKKLQDSLEKIPMLENLKKFSFKIVKDTYGVFSDVEKSKYEIVISFVLIVFLSLLFIVIMRYIAGCFVWICIFLLLSLLGAGSYFSFIEYKGYSKEQEKHNTTFDYDDNIDKQIKNPKIWLTIFIICISLFIIFTLLILFLRKRIILAIAIIKEGSKAVSAVTSTLLFPIIPWILQILAVLYVIFLGVHLYTARDTTYTLNGNLDGCDCVKQASGYKIGGFCKISDFEKFCRNTTNMNTKCKTAECQFQGYSIPGVNTFFEIYNVFAFFWIISFISDFGDMILAGTFATWYFTMEKKKLPLFTVLESLIRTIRFHLGTIAFGSLIIAICRFLKAMFEYLRYYLEKYENNRYIQVILHCLECCFACVEKFMKIVNKNAYIMCAIHGKSFCESAARAFKLIVDNCMRFATIDYLTSFLFFIAKFLIAILAGGLATLYYVMTEKTTQVDYVFVPILIITIGGYLIASLFFSVYSMAVDTLFLCSMEDMEINDGSEEKPYFMSKSLMKALKVKNELLIKK